MLIRRKNIQDLHCDPSQKDEHWRWYTTLTKCKSTHLLRKSMPLGSLALSPILAQSHSLDAHRSSRIDLSVPQVHSTFLMKICFFPRMPWLPKQARASTTEGGTKQASFTPPQLCAPGIRSHASPIKLPKSRSDEIPRPLYRSYSMLI